VNYDFWAVKGNHGCSNDQSGFAWEEVSRYQSNATIKDTYTIKLLY